jgi:hypothetical protein
MCVSVDVKDGGNRNPMEEQVDDESQPWKLEWADLVCAVIQEPEAGKSGRTWCFVWELKCWCLNSTSASSLAAGLHHLRHRLELPPPRGLLLGLNPPVLPHLRLLEGLTEQHWDLSTATAV